MGNCIDCKEFRKFRVGQRCHACYETYRKNTSLKDRGIHSISQSSVRSGMGECTVCGVVDVCLKRGRFICKEKKREHQRKFDRDNPGKLRDRRTRLKSWMDDTYARQGQKCSICKTPKSLDNLVIDHDHRAPCKCSRRSACLVCVRGLLCGTCNSGLGMFKDNPAFLREAVVYLTTPR